MSVMFLVSGMSVMFVHGVLGVVMFRLPMASLMTATSLSDVLDVCRFYPLWLCFSWFLSVVSVITVHGVPVDWCSWCLSMVSLATVIQSVHGVLDDFDVLDDWCSWCLPMVSLLTLISLCLLGLSVIFVIVPFLAVMFGMSVRGVLDDLDTLICDSRIVCP
jgi:hypothetical protein